MIGDDVLDVQLVKAMRADPLAEQPRGGGDVGPSGPGPIDQEAVVLVRDHVDLFVPGCVQVQPAHPYRACGLAP